MKLKKGIRIGTMAVGGIVLLAVVLGVLNALVGGGNWYLGWQSYRYDDSGYETGDGTVRADSVRRIVVDWVDGEVEIVSCQDRYLSLTEESREELTDANLLRWQVSEDGETLTVRYRKSSWFLGSSGRKNKKLILRIPEQIQETLTSLELEAVSASVTLSEVRAERITLTGTSGRITLNGCCANALEVTGGKGEIFADGTFSGAVRLDGAGNLSLNSTVCPSEVAMKSKAGKTVALTLPKSSGFTLETDAASISQELPLTHTEDGKYQCGDGSAAVRVEAPKSELLIFARK